MEGSLARSLAISIGAHAVLFLILALLIPHKPVVFAAPSITFFEGQAAGNGGAKGNGGRKATPAPVAHAVPATPRQTPPPQAPPAQQVPATLPAAVPTASPPATSGEPSNQVPSGGSSGSGSAGSGGTGDGGPGGVGSGTASASAPETDTDSPSLVADINPAPMWPIAPTYPSSARRLNQQGSVKVETDINEKGAVTACRVAVSSGFPSLDNAAVNAVQQARFLPAMKNGKAVASRILIPFKFELTRE